MKKRLIIGALLVALVLLMAACGCKHEWQVASCTAPKTCTLCGEVEGEALGHTWQEATCEAAKTCATCHSTEGEALGHDWVDATTQTPKTCNRCQKTEGERIVTDPRFTTETTKHLQGTWTCDFNMSAEMLGLPEGFEDGIDVIMTLEFGNAGDLVSTMKLKDAEAFNSLYREITLQLTYATLEQQGISKEQADEAMLEAEGLTVEEYVDVVLDKIDMEAMLEAFNDKEVYYVEGNKIYTALTWNSKNFEGSAYTVNNGVLVVDDIDLGEDGEPLTWKKAE